ncbi:MAG TPA: hypothetical protein VI338_01605 [Nitrososphaera sp.]|nr:hypothetical protein [Nitrososphaera sp.]
MNTLDSRNISHREEACKTFIEQTKLLTSLASAFIVAPAVVFDLIGVIWVWPIIGAEMLFVISVLAGYIAMGAIAGTQNKGEYDVYRPAARISGLIQFFAYLTGIALFGYWFLVSYSNTIVSKP